MKSLLKSLRSWWRANRLTHVRDPADFAEKRGPLLLVVEGRHDMEFLRRISALVLQDDPTLPDLRLAELNRRVVFIPVGGSPLWTWASRLAQLGRPEFHLYDREISPETETRQQIVRAINLRAGCRAVLTGKRGLENYLHPSAIEEAGGIQVEITDDCPVAELVAQARYRAITDKTPWENLTPRARKRQRERAKRWLNTQAVECMTVERLNESDPRGDIRTWLKAIAILLNQSC